MSAKDEGHSAFFYGTLMAPQVLHRVTHGSTPNDPKFVPDHIKVVPAILHNYRRHRVKHADYPAIVPVPSASVRGTYVTGLRDADIWRLDIFEGDEYVRKVVKVRLLTAVGDESGQGNVEGDEVEAETYVWKASRNRLEDGEWDFAEFQREKMRFWVGSEGQEEYEGFADEALAVAEVDEAVAEKQVDGTGGRGSNGHITRALKDEPTNEPMRNAV
ncbi:hypothetical protein B0A48_00739 [Cryoendolithus antarcticus]|uniref:Putative gamma-glutamylcyclotransferase n=1 Tax=Cryoendolithus antarcticus TaxID=1507870 RepID=A0A1V8TRE0_9PEZI|nr:hypothetical protein B0A48_00739 [Cryoendolithus antarcticus]